MPNTNPFLSIPASGRGWCNPGGHRISSIAAQNQRYARSPYNIALGPSASGQLGSQSQRYDSNRA